MTLALRAAMKATIREEAARMRGGEGIKGALEQRETAVKTQKRTAKWRSMARKSRTVKSAEK